MLAQSFGDFELLIADNASTDAREDLCRKYAAVDDRISYVTHRENYRPIANFNDVFRLTMVDTSSGPPPTNLRPRLSQPLCRSAGLGPHRGVGMSTNRRHR